MKKSILLATAIVTSALWAGLALAVNVTPTPAPDGTAPVVDPAAAPPAGGDGATPEAGATAIAQDPAHQSDAFLRQKAYLEKREEMKRRRDEALKIREQNAH